MDRVGRCIAAVSARKRESCMGGAFVGTGYCMEVDVADIDPEEVVDVEEAL